MIAHRPYIIYKLPISRVTQALTGKKIEKAWDNINTFIKNCTTANIENPHSIYLTGYTADEDHGELADLAEKALENTRSHFGSGETRPVGYHYPENTPTKQTKTNWDLNDTHLEKALNYLIQGQPWPKYNLGPIELILSYDFKLIDIKTKLELPDQQFTSSILIWLSRNNSIAPTLCFPFETPNDDFWEYIKSIEPFFPFKFDSKNLRLGKSNKKGTFNVFTKL